MILFKNGLRFKLQCLETLAALYIYRKMLIVDSQGQTTIPLDMLQTELYF